MGHLKLNKWELEVQSRLAEGSIAEAENVLVEAGNKIRFICRTIFEASIGLASGDLEHAWTAIAAGLQRDGHNYELYLLLGDYYAHYNLQQTYLCYENALFYCDVPEDAEQIQCAINRLEEQGVSLPRTAIVILSYNLLDMTRECIESIRDTAPESAREIIVVDNASKDGSVEWLKEQSDIKLLCNVENKGFPAGCNQGIALAEADSDILLLNNDTVMTDNALFWLRMGLYENEQVGSTGCVSNFVSNFQAVIENGKSKSEYLNFAKKNNIPLRNPYLNKVYLVGFALLVKRTVLNQIGLLDESFSPGNFEDNDICLRISLAGFRNVLCKNSFIIHWGSRSFRKEPHKYNNILKINQKKFFEKWSSMQLDDDNYWNIRPDLFSILESEKRDSDNVIMLVGTGCGAFPGYLKDKYPDMHIYGMEERRHIAQIADRIVDTVWVNLDKWNGDELAGTFDIIIINDSLEYVKNPTVVLRELAKMLKQNGKFIISFQNGQHFSKIGRHDSRPSFERAQMEEVLSDVKLSSESWMCTQMGNSENPELIRIIRKLQEQYPFVNEDALWVYQWIVIAKKQTGYVEKY